MSREKWDADDMAQMKKIERAIIDVVLPLIQGVDPLLALYAMIRCARVMLRKGDTHAQRAVLPVIHAYLDGKTTAPGAGSLLWMPPGDFTKH
jgi:hypothetical protein